MFSEFQQKIVKFTKRLVKHAPKMPCRKGIAVNCSNHEVTLQDDTRRQLIVNGVLDLTMKVVKLWYSGHAQPPRNTLFSPINIYLTLVLSYFVADDGSSDEIASLLHFPQDDDEKQRTHEVFSQMLQILQNDPEPVSRIVHGIFVQKDCDKLQSNASQARTHYNTEITDVDFLNDPTSAIKRINQFISQRTNHRIPTIFETPLELATNAILVSSINFQARWHKPFSQEDTTEENFFTDSGTSPTTLMSRYDYTPYINMPDLQLEAISLPYAVQQSQSPEFERDERGFLRFPSYEEYQLSMFFVLPYRDRTLKDSISFLDASTLRQIVKQSESTCVHVKIPQMECKWIDTTGSSLQELAISELFNKNAELDSIIGDIPSKLSQTTHDSEIIADYVMVAKQECDHHKDEPILFCVDRPYLIFVYHHVFETVLFIGTVHDPNAPCDGPTSK